MKRCYVLIIAPMLFGFGCGKTAAPTPVQWEYSTFKFHEPEPFLEDYKSVCYIQFSNGNGTWYGSNTVYQLDEVLNRIGKFGWELTASNGKDYTVKRPADVFTNGVFIVEETTIKKGSQ